MPDLIQPTPPRPRVALLAGAVLSLALPAPSAGQGAAFSTELLYAAGNAAPCGNGTQAITTVTARGARASLLPAPVTAFARDRIGAPVVAAGYESDPRRPWQFMASGALGRSSEACAMRSSESRALVGVGRRVGSGGVALTLGAPSLSSLDPSRDRRGVTLGAWRSVGRARLSLELRGHDGRINGWRDTTVFVPGGGPLAGDSGRSPVDTVEGTNRRDSIATSADWRALDLRTRAQLSFGPLLLDVTVGGTRAPHGPTRGPGPDPLTDSSARVARNTIRMWGRADARLSIGSSVQVIGAMVSLPAQPGARVVPGPVFMLGMGITGLPRTGRAHPSPTRPEARSPDEGPVAFEVVRADSIARVRLRLPGASVVELSSELTGWRAVAMTREGGEWWAVPLRAEPGVYRVNIRVDGGAWTPPPGVPSVRDEFGGSVGMVPIR